jgi:polyribonucleotide nucleotidyltransferase
MCTLLDYVCIVAVGNYSCTALVLRYVGQLTAILAGKPFKPHASIQQLTAADIAVVRVVARIGIIANGFADTGAKIDIEDDGTVYVAAVNRTSAEAAKAIIDAICFEPEVGAVYTGKVTGIKEFGCFVEYAPGKEGMVHISKIADHRVEKVEDVLKLGDTVKVKYIGLDNKGRMDFSIKDAQ